MRLSGPLAVVVAAAVTAPGAACGSGKRPAPVVVAMAGQTAATAKRLTIAAGICDAARQAAGDTHAPPQALLRQAHHRVPLPARGPDDRRRGAPARVPERKQNVEAALP